MNSNIFKVITSMFIVNLLSKGLGFFRDYLMAIKFGTTLEADSYLMASNIPNVMFIILGTAIMTVIIPVYNEIKLKSSKKDLEDFTSNILTLLVIISVFLTIICEIFTPVIVRGMAIGFYGEKFELTVKLTRILASVIVLNTIIYTFNAILQCEDNFTLPAAIGIPYNLFLIAYYMFFSERFGVTGIAIVVSLALIIQILILLNGLKRVNFKYRFFINLKDNNLKRIIKLLPPICIGTGMSQLNGIFNGVFASQLNNGSVSALNYAMKLNTLIIDIVIMTIVTIIYQNISKAAIDKNSKEIFKKANESVLIMFLVLVPIVVTSFVYSEYIVKFLFQRGEFNYNSTLMTSGAFKFYCLGLFAIAINSILSRICYAVGDTKTPMINTFISLTINIIFSWILVKIVLLEINGIALASIIGSWISAIILYFNVKRKVNYTISIETLKDLFKMIISSIPLIILLLISKERIIFLISNNNLIEIVKMMIIFIIGVLIYLGMLFIMRAEIVRKLRISRIKGEIKNAN